MANRIKIYREIFDVKYITILYEALIQTHITYGRYKDMGWYHRCSFKTIRDTILCKNYMYPKEKLYKKAKTLDILQICYLGCLLTVLYK